MTRRLLAAIGIVVLLVVALTIVLPASSGGPCRDSAPLCDRLNEIRINHDRDTLKQRDGLQRVANLWAESMGLSGVLKHNPDLAKQTVGFFGENVGYGPTWRTVFRAFMMSSCKPWGTYDGPCPGHREIILDRDYTEIGIGSYQDNGSIWIVLVFQ